jgi:hypothetical protein
MSNKNRVNPDHYKLAGRDPQGETIRHDRARQMLGTQRSRSRGGNFIPGAEDHHVGAMAAKHGMKSDSTKAATSHYGTRAMPSTRGAAGAFGREPGSEPRVKRKKTTTSTRATKNASSTRAKARGKGKRAA